MKRARRPRPRGSERAPAAPAVVTIDAIAAGGDGVARSEGMVVFVPRTAPGDVAEVDVRARGRFARGLLRAVRTASPVRTDPRCAHYVMDKCGGCQLQHMTYESQLAAKAQIVADSFTRIAKRPIAPPEVHASPDPWGYRRKLTLSLRRRGREWIAGLRAFDDPDHVFALRECPITGDQVLAVWRTIIASGELLPDVAELRGAVQLDESDGASFVLEGGGTWPESGAFFDRTTSLDSLWWRPDNGTLRCLHHRSQRFPGASFMQVNGRVGMMLQSFVNERVLAGEPRSMVDAYAGAGETAQSAARRGVRAIAIELDENAVAWCRTQLPTNARAIAARVEDALPSALPADLVVLNPPRTGVDARVCETLESAVTSTRSIIYVSCDPATLARDLARLPSWRIAHVTCFDMFPQTAHVETVCELVPAESAA